MEKCRDVLLEVHTVIAAFVFLIFFSMGERNFRKTLVTKPFKKTICKTKA